MCFFSGVAWQWYGWNPAGLASNSYVNDWPGATI